MATKEALTRLNEARLMLDQAPTHMGNAGLIAKNVEMYPGGSLTKRAGFRRFRDIQEAFPVSGIVSVEDRLLVMAGDLDEQS